AAPAAPVREAPEPRADRGPDRDRTRSVARRVRAHRHPRRRGGQLLPVRDALLPGLGAARRRRHRARRSHRRGVVRAAGQLEPGDPAAARDAAPRGARPRRGDRRARDRRLGGDRQDLGRSRRPPAQRHRHGRARTHDRDRPRAATREARAMTTRRDDWKARLRGWLFDDILRKLIAIVLAVGLWLWLDQQLEDSRTLILALQPVELASPEETAGSHELAVRYDGDRYRVIGFRDAFTDQPEIDVALTLQGPRHLIAQLDENRGFSVVPQQRPGEPPVAEFDIGRIRAQNPRFQPLLRALDPPVVRVLLERKVERDFPFSREAVEIEAPGAEWLFPRLLLDQIDFEPRSEERRGG